MTMCVDVQSDRKKLKENWKKKVWQESFSLSRKMVKHENLKCIILLGKWDSSRHLKTINDWLSSHSNTPTHKHTHKIEYISQGIIKLDWYGEFYFPVQRQFIVILLNAITDFIGEKKNVTSVHTMYHAKINLIH